MKTRIFFYAIASSGLGHVHRCTAIARKLVKLYDVEVLILTDSGVNQTQEHGIHFYGIDTHKLRTEEPSHWGILNMHFIGVCLKAYQPHIVIVDAFPRGYFDELSQIIPRVNASKILIRRQVSQRMNKIENEYFFSNYNACIVPHTQEEYTISEGLEKRIPKIHYSGPILLRDKDEVLSKEDSLKLLGLEPDQRPRVLISVGGGGLKEYDNLIAHVDGLAEHHPEYAFSLLRGPMTNNSIVMPVKASVISYTPILECLNAFDALLFMGASISGYEAFSLGIPAVGVPIWNGSDDPTTRLKALESKNICLVAEPNPDTWGPKLQELFTRYEEFQTNGRNFVPENGASGTADFIMSCARR